MKVLLSVLLLVSSLGVMTVLGQNNAQETVEDIEYRLIEVRAKEEVGRIQLAELDELMKPENIERALAGVGSTRPEELREQRRRQLNAERTVVAAQLDQLVAERTRLESALETARNQAYLQSPLENSPIDNAFRVGLMKGSWLVAMLVVGGVSLVTMGTFVVWGHYLVKAHRRL